MSATLAPVIVGGLEPTEEHFDPYAPSTIDARHPCEACEGSGAVEWDDHIIGPCPACQGDPLIQRGETVRRAGEPAGSPHRRSERLAGNEANVRLGAQ